MNALKAIERLEKLDEEITALNYAISAMGQKDHLSNYVGVIQEIRKNKGLDRERIKSALESVKISL